MVLQVVSVQAFLIRRCISSPNFKHMNGTPSNASAGFSNPKVNKPPKCQANGWGRENACTGLSNPKVNKPPSVKQVSDYSSSTRSDFLAR